MAEKGLCLVLTCEHGGNHIPPDYQPFFNAPLPKKALLTHRGQDFGALDLAKKLQESLKAPLFFSKISRLLIDCNRSLGHPRLFSEFSKPFNPMQKERIIQSYYLPYRSRVENEMTGRIMKGFKVLHLSIHSFTPEMDGKTRNADIGILYNPKRPSEKAIALFLKRRINELLPEFRVRFNYPYLGISDGFATHLRKNWPDQNYSGLELEINQRVFSSKKKINPNWEQKLIESIQAAYSRFDQENSENKRQIPEKQNRNQP